MSVHKVDFGMQKTPEDVLENLCRFLRNEVEAYGTPRAVMVLVLDENNKISMKVNPLIPMNDDEWVGIIARAFHLSLMKSFDGFDGTAHPDAS